MNQLPSLLCRSLKKIVLFVLILISGGFWGAAKAGGGGENLLLVVNPNEEWALRIANAYIAARHIPANNVLYIVPPSSGGGGATQMVINEAALDSVYINPIYNAIAARGLINQIDYIGVIGQPHVVFNLAFTDCLAQLTQLHNGMTAASIISRPSELLQDPTFFNTHNFDYSYGTNAAIHHSQALPNLSGTSPTPTVQWYMAGMIGYAGQHGLQADQVIQSLQRSVAGDGAKPQGTFYFENSGDAARSGTRKYYWASVEGYMTAHGIPWIEEASALPVNRPDVMGVQIGVAGFFAPQGSNYLPGSWADNLTSYGGIYYSDAGPNETTTSMLIQAGCAASGGTILEPLAVQERFPLCDIFVFQHEGSTLGEAFYKSLKQPDLNMFHGDLLSQPFADIPLVSFTSAPSDGAIVNGIIQVSATASLNNPSIATGIASFTLFVDGTNSGLTSSGNSSATFNLNTTTLSDGCHELRAVAYNNSQAASEGYAILNVAVNNHGQSVGIAGTNSYNINWNQTLPLSVSAIQGSGPTITGIQLQSNGRVLGSISGTGGIITVNATQLAFRGNPITPVALLSNGGQILGPTIMVNQMTRPFYGTKITPFSNQNPGFDFYYYPGAAGNTLATTNFTGTPAMVGHGLGAVMNSSLNLPTPLLGGSGVGLAISMNASFTVTTAGEYLFCPRLSDWTSVGILIDGVLLRSFDRWNGSSYLGLSMGYSFDTYDDGVSAYLLPGEHTVTIQLAQATLPNSGLLAKLFYSSPRVGVPFTYARTGDYQPGVIIGAIPAAPTFYTIQKTNGH